MAATAGTSMTWHCPSPSVQHVGWGHFQPCKCLKPWEIYTDRHPCPRGPPSPPPSSRACLNHVSRISTTTNALRRTSMGSHKHPQSCGELGTSLQSWYTGKGMARHAREGESSRSCPDSHLGRSSGPTDHRSPAKGCAVCWKSGCAVPSQQIPFAFPGAIPASIAPHCSSPLAVFPSPEHPCSCDAGQRCWLPSQPERASRLVAARPWQWRSEARPLTQPSVLSLPLAFYF